MNENPLPDEAREALARAGDPLRRQLDAMRREENAPTGIKALDPQARLALFRKGDELLSRLAEERAALQKRRRLRWARRLSVAAACILFIGILATLPADAPQPPKPQAQSTPPPAQEFPVPTSVDTHSMPNPAVPEPGTGLLLITGSAFLLLRRRR